MEHPEQLLIVQHLLKALHDVNYWSRCVPHATIRELSPETVSQLCNELKDFARYSKDVRTLCYEENLFDKTSEDVKEVD